ncbi:putative deoxyribonuclease TATDN2 [Octopus vulgaris]|uniref:Deoxyribonuclease TATDN2 n=1 Tax=Octopus vulgaris TaxID=6645 RepID=A0AA36BND3_OCTVU|nr:putative deoxyribonuclease TATDN2 [Octopus vulgaris]
MFSFQVLKFTLNSSEYFKNVLYRSFSWLYSNSIQSLSNNVLAQDIQRESTLSKGILDVYKSGVNPLSTGSSSCSASESSFFIVDVTQEGKLSYIPTPNYYYSDYINSLSPNHSQMATKTPKFNRRKSLSSISKSSDSIEQDVTPVKSDSFSKSGCCEENENIHKTKRSRYSLDVKNSHRHCSSPKLHSYKSIASSSPKRRRRHTYSTSSSFNKEERAHYRSDANWSKMLVSPNCNTSLFASPVTLPKDASRSLTPPQTQLNFLTSTPLSVKSSMGNQTSDSTSKRWKFEKYLSQHKLERLSKSLSGTPQYYKWKKHSRKKLSEAFPFSRSLVDNHMSLYNTSSSSSSSSSSCSSSIPSYGKNWKKMFLDKCSNLANSFIDSHCHVDFLFNRLPFKGSFKKYRLDNADTFPANYGGCVAVFCEPKSFSPDGSLWKSLNNESEMWFAMGCHPKNVENFDSAAEKGLRECIEQPKVVAIGEIGLDYSGRFWETASLQKKVFIHQIKLALTVQKPLVIHCREAQDDCLQILKKYVPVDYRIHCHCFTKSFKYAKEWLSYFPNLFIGLTPLVTYPSALEVHNTAYHIPLDRLLLETDSPYFVPRLVPRGYMKFSHPGFAVAVAFEVAQLKDVLIDVVLKHCWQNTKKMYGI